MAELRVLDLLTWAIAQARDPEAPPEETRYRCPHCGLEGTKAELLQHLRADTCRPLDRRPGRV
jgi:hypothetical protein